MKNFFKDFFSTVFRYFLSSLVSEEGQVVGCTCCTNKLFSKIESVSVIVVCVIEKNYFLIIIYFGNREKQRSTFQTFSKVLKNKNLLAKSVLFKINFFLIYQKVRFRTIVQNFYLSLELIFQPGQIELEIRSRHSLP